MAHNMTRRDLLKQTAFAAAAAATLGATRGAAAAPEGPGMPAIRLGSLEVSRLIMGSNPFWGYAHKPGSLGKEMTDYYTDERIVAVMDEAAALGVTSIACPPEERWIKLWDKYQSAGGKMKVWIAQCHGRPEKMKEEISLAVKSGAKAVFIQGHRVEDEFLRRRQEVVRGWVDHIKTLNVPAGMASHKQDIHLKAEELGFATDFYYQCLYIPDTYLESDREKALATIAKLTKPVIAYKILAAGRLPARDAFAYALGKIAPKDGICVGIYPKDQPDQVRQDVGLTIELSKR